MIGKMEGTGNNKRFANAFAFFEYYLHAFMVVWEVVVVATAIHADHHFGHMLSQWFYAMNVIYFYSLLSENQTSRMLALADVMTPTMFAANLMWAIMSLAVALLGDSVIAYDQWPYGGPDIADWLGTVAVAANHVAPAVLTLVHFLVHRHRIAQTLADIAEWLYVRLWLFVPAICFYVWVPLLPFIIFVLAGHPFETYGVPRSREVYIWLIESGVIFMYALIQLGSFLLLRHWASSSSSDEEVSTEEPSGVPGGSPSKLESLDGSVALDGGVLESCRGSCLGAEFTRRRFDGRTSTEDVFALDEALETVRVLTNK
jgi:hypothetical protein